MTRSVVAAEAKRIVRAVADARRALVVDEYSPILEKGKEYADATGT